MVLRTFNAFISAPNAPFTEFVPLWRQTLGRWHARGEDYNQQMGVAYNLPELEVAVPPEAHWAKAVAVRIGFVVACLFIFGLTEALLRMQPIAILQAAAMGHSLRSGFWHGTRLGLRHAGHIMRHSWELRLGFCVFSVLFAVCPQVIYEGVLLGSHAKWLTAGLPFALGGTAGFLVAWAMLQAAWAAFCAACDVRLYVHIQASAANNAFASNKSAVSNPSVNQP